MSPERLIFAITKSTNSSLNIVALVKLTSQGQNLNWSLWKFLAEVFRLLRKRILQTLLLINF